MYAWSLRCDASREERKGGDDIPKHLHDLCVLLTILLEGKLTLLVVVLVLSTSSVLSSLSLILRHIVLFVELFRVMWVFWWLLWNNCPCGRDVVVGFFGWWWWCCCLADEFQKRNKTEEGRMGARRRRLRGSLCWRGWVYGRCVGFPRVSSSTKSCGTSKRGAQCSTAAATGFAGCYPLTTVEEARSSCLKPPCSHSGSY